jgi:hypothetical protein
VALATAAEHTAQSITDPDSQAQALVELVGAWAAAGQLDRAEQTARSITDPDPQAHALVELVKAWAAVGQHDRAEQTARSITKPDWQAQALSDLATVVEPARARSLIVGALAVGRWPIPLRALAHVEWLALSAFVDECEPHRPPDAWGSAP